MQRNWLKELNIVLPREKIFENEPMKKHTSFKIGGPADVYIKATSIDDVKQVIEISNKNNVPLFIIGNGSNLLVNDQGIRGIVLKIEMNKTTISQKKDEVYVKAECGITMAALAYELLQQSITGFEELSGIPGTIGGAIKMNAGAHGKEMKDVVFSTTYIDMNEYIHTITNKEHNFEYRNSMFSSNNFIILETTLILKNGNKEKIKSAMEKYSACRKEKQPLEHPNAGSTFKRGDDFITARLIDECGLKGYTIGGAQVSTKHAGFIINNNNATAEDVLKLIEYVQKEVYKKTGKKIELEIQVI